METAFMESITCRTPELLSDCTEPTCESSNHTFRGGCFASPK
eukprot:CAMPEP_0175831134 /NCGR_PEP_ID=MMETSP0107_2-20121207/14299_1 /TAXON_ID=195067 ORGANISM="Goniomonas pacifica, Strain CCMP1869" /NCGR_SAMPLE_ID=MMETSP0107_2 /ASSEMBLY_ACC=CAM_ASM_000203 /LENGTH=41 /DNA_ID=CAMNT_0017144145 /DNA_START=491 /DNA_END=616 /DNA_ORIENTATION=+